MHMISNQQRQDVIDFLTSFIELTADKGSNRVYNLKRRAGLLVRKLKDNKEIDYQLVKRLKDELKKIEIEVPNGKKPEWVNGVLTLVDEKPQNVMERVKTFKDACNELGIEHDKWVQDKKDLGLEADVIAYLKLRIIAAALNEGWKPQFTTDEYRYFPWFYLYTQSEIDEMSEEEKSRVVYRSSGNANASGGVAYAYTLYDSSNTSTHIGSRLAFKTRELAEYAGRQFVEIWADYVFKPEEEK